MGVLPDHIIRKLAVDNSMISPFVDKQINVDASMQRLVSYGVSSYGYDARLADKLYVFCGNRLIDPKQNDASIEYEEIDPGADFIIPPNSFALGRTVEYFKVPQDIIVICVGKSTYARCGLVVNVTPIEPGWEGYITLEFSNTTQAPIKIYPNEGICQLIFLQGKEKCEISYKDRRGKYMMQQCITLPKL